MTARIKEEASHADGRRNGRVEYCAGGACVSQFERRRRHRAEIARRFAAEVAQCITSTLKSWEKGSVVLAAEPGMLGLLREAVQDALPRGVVLKALAKDYVELSPSELAQRLNLR